MFDGSTKIYSLSNSVDKIREIAKAYEERTPGRERFEAAIPDEVQQKKKRSRKQSHRQDREDS